MTAYLISFLCLRQRYVFTQHFTNGWVKNKPSAVGVYVTVKKCSVPNSYCNSSFTLTGLEEILLNIVVAFFFPLL